MHELHNLKLIYFIILFSFVGAAQGNGNEQDASLVHLAKTEVILEITQLEYQCICKMHLREPPKSFHLNLECLSIFIFCLLIGLFDLNQQIYVMPVFQ